MKIKKHIEKNLVTNLIVADKIKTTLTRAKAIQSTVDRLINFAKLQNLHGRRQIERFISDQKALRKIIQDLGLRFGARQSGFTRIVRLSRRAGDMGQLVQLEFVETRTSTPKEAIKESEVKESGKSKKPKTKIAKEPIKAEKGSKAKADKSETGKASRAKAKKA